MEVSSSTSPMDAANDAVLQARLFRLQHLVDQKVDKLAVQKRLADQANYLLCRKDADGLNEHSRLTCKSVKVAITVSRKPGYFSYYTGTEEVKRVESSRALNQLARQIKAVQQDIDQVTSEIESIRSSHPDKPAILLNSTDQWMRMYGGPSGYDMSSHTFTSEPPKGLFSTFTPNPKIFGKTNHHPAFKSQAVTLKKARLTK